MAVDLLDPEAFVSYRDEGCRGRWVVEHLPTGIRHLGRTPDREYLARCMAGALTGLARYVGLTPTNPTRFTLEDAR